MIRLAPALLLLALAGCGGASPPASAPETAGGYDKDRLACHDEAVTQVNKTNAKRALDWFSSPVRRWGQISDAQSSCMLAKGHEQTRWCSGEELAAAQRAGRVVVTASGVQCLQPPGKS